jgi:sensor histidine kinase YesM
MVGQLSDLLRHSMDDAAAPEIPLRQELALLERYVDIMRVRFADQLAVETRVDPQALDALVPNMVLQPLVENAIKHGVEQRADGGRVEIDAALEGDTLVLRVRDNGPVPPQRLSMPAVASPADAASDVRVGLGLRNTAARLAQLYGAEYRLTLGPGPDGGAMAEIRLPHRTRAGVVDKSEKPSAVGEHTEAPRDVVARVD